MADTFFRSESKFAGYDVGDGIVIPKVALVTALGSASGVKVDRSLVTDGSNQAAAPANANRAALLIHNLDAALTIYVNFDNEAGVLVNGSPAAASGAWAIGPGDKEDFSMFAGELHVFGPAGAAVTIWEA